MGVLLLILNRLSCIAAPFGFFFTDIATRTNVAVPPPIQLFILSIVICGTVNVKLLVDVGLDNPGNAAGLISDKPPSVQASVPKVPGITRSCADNGPASMTSNKRAINL